MAKKKNKPAKKAPKKPVKKASKPTPSKNESRHPHPREVLKGSIDDVKERVNDIENPNFKWLIDEEIRGKNRKTLLEWLEKEMWGSLTPEEREREKARQERIDLAKKFTDELLDRYGSWIKSVIVWGSTSRNEFTEKSDIDFVILVDDTREKLQKKDRRSMDDWIYERAKEMDERLSPQPVWTITEFVNMTRSFTPLSYELLKDGIPTYDTGFFLTHKRLLELGEISATPESAQRHWGQVPKRISRVKNSKLYLIAEDLYYAMIKAQESVLMYMGREVPHPVHAADYMKKYLVEPGMLDPKYVDWLDDVVRFHKAVEHKEITEVDGEEIDRYLERAEEFVEEMETILMELEIQRKRRDIQRAYDIMVRATVAALDAVGDVPEDPDRIPQAFHEQLVQKEMMSPFYEEVLEGVLFMHNKSRSRQVEDISERYIALTSEYVRRFVSEVRAFYQERDLDFEETAARIDEEDIPLIEVDVDPIESALSHHARRRMKREEEDAKKKLEQAGAPGGAEKEEKPSDDEGIAEHTTAR